MTAEVSSPKRRKIPWIACGFLLIALWLLGWALLNCIAIWNWFGFSVGNQPIPYFFYVSLFTLRPSLGVCIIPGVIVFVLLIIFVTSHRNRSHQSKDLRSTGIIGCLGSFILLIANTLACGAAIPGSLSGEDFTQYSDVQLGSHIYRLDFVAASNGPGANSADLELWECDNLGFFCRQVHDEDVTALSFTYDAAGYIDTRLTVGANSISMQLNGKVIYVYSSDKGPE